MDYEGPPAASERWAWRERKVDLAKDHFELRYGSAEGSDWNAWMPVARVGRPVKRVFGVEFIIDPADSASAPMMRTVVGELDFYLVTKRERNPWAYARYHCGTAANLYSSVHWSFHSGEETKDVSRPEEEDAMELTPGKKAARTKARKAAGAKAAATRKHRAAGKKAAQTRKRRAAGKKAAVSRKRLAAAGKAAATRRAKRGGRDADPRGVLRRLLAAKRIRASESDVVSQDQGLYVLWTAGRKATCLKVGIAGPRKGKGLRQRLHLHYVSNAANSVLARHLAGDSTSQWATGVDFRVQQQRQAFLATKCFFRVLPVPEVSRSALLRLESFLVERLKPVYAGRVNKRA